MFSQYLKQNNKLSIALSLIFTLPTLTWALTEDVEKPVNIEADAVMFNNEKGIADYDGNVVILQGSLQIRAAKVNIQAPEHEITSIVATGSPVKLQQTMDDGQLVQGQANTVTYNVKGERIVLTGNAKLQQGKDVITNNNIEYLPGSGELHAGGKKHSGRVKAIFHPSNKVKKPTKSTKKKAKK